MALLLSQTALLGVSSERTSKDTSEAASLAADAILLGALSGVLVAGLVALLSEFGHDCLRNEPHDEGHNPGCHTKDACYDPMIDVNSFVANLHSFTADLDNDHLSNDDAYEDDAENGVFVNTAEDVLIIVNDSSIEDVED